MAPGPKKKNPNRQAGETRQDNKKNISTTNTQPQPRPTVNNSNPVNKDPVEDGKYSKRTVNSNWSKYDEPVVNPHADTLRGQDFGVLLSYSGGGSSQLQLQDEKEWDGECGNEDDFLTLDLQEVENAIKCIPFHKRLHLPEDVFDKAQLEKFELSACDHRKAFESKLDVAPTPAKSEEVVKEPVLADPDSDIIESYESEIICEAPVKSQALEEKTENLIESLASSLSLKSLLPKSEKQSEKLHDKRATDDLDFLLSLGTSTKSIVKEDKTKEKSQTNVDDWLNNLLDD